MIVTFVFAIRVKKLLYGKLKVLILIKKNSLLKIKFYF